MKLTFGDKFALLAIENVYTDLPPEDQQLPDGTWILSRVPVEIEANWTQWIGSVRADKIREANLVFVRSIKSANPILAGDAEQSALTQHVAKLFSLLQLGGVPEYNEADVLAGSVLNDGPIIRQMSRLPKFHSTKGYVRQPVNLDRLEKAATMRFALDQIENLVPARFARFVRGLNTFKEGLEQNTGQERLHQFVRSLEALVLPAIGSTRSQFTHRCQTFAKANPTAKTTLEQAYDMRSDTEHLQDWNRALKSYPEPEREDIALHRTRQMERLAMFAYSRILENKTLQSNFVDDGAQETFWKQTEGPRQTMWGSQLDLGAVPLVCKYDGFNRAA